MFVAIAIHHAAPEHVEDFVAFSRWESEQAYLDALPLIGSLAHERREEWSERPDDVLMLSPA